MWKVLDNSARNFFTSEIEKGKSGNEMQIPRQQLFEKGKNN